MSGSQCYALTMLQNVYILFLLSLFQCAYTQIRINWLMIHTFIISRCHSPLFWFQVIVIHCLSACCGTYRFLKTKEHRLPSSCPSCIKLFWQRSSASISLNRIVRNLQLLAFHIYQALFIPTSSLQRLFLRFCLDHSVNFEEQTYWSDVYSSGVLRSFVPFFLATNLQILLGC